MDAGIIFTGALAQFGIPARIEPTWVTICDAHGQEGDWNEEEGSAR